MNTSRWKVSLTIASSFSPMVSASAYPLVSTPYLFSILLDETRVVLIDCDFGIVVVGGGWVPKELRLEAVDEEVEVRFIRRRSDKSCLLTWEMYDVPRGTVS